MNSKFIFPSLDPERNDIRLAKLLPRKSSADSLRLKLTTHELTEGLEFTALSYTWGSPSANKVVVNGQDYYIFDNLFNFLSHRSVDTKFCTSVFLWVDQICINQQDVLERNHQVDRMGDIYTFASDTIVWLGQPGKDRNIPPSSVADFAQSVRDGRLPPVLTGEDLQSLKSNVDWTDPLLWRSKDFMVMVFGLVLLGSAEYWDRLWVIQEALLSKRLSVQFDSEVIRWTDLYGYTMKYKGFLTSLEMSQLDSRKILDHSSRAIRPMERLLDFRMSTRTNSQTVLGTLTWASMLKLMENAKCQVIQDKAFGLMGLIRPSLRIPADYQKEISETYLNIVCAEVKERKLSYVAPIKGRSASFAEELALVLKVDYHELKHELRIRTEGKWNDTSKRQALEDAKKRWRPSSTHQELGRKKNEKLRREMTDQQQPMQAEVKVDELQQLSVERRYYEILE